MHDSRTTNDRGGRWRRHLALSLVFLVALGLRGLHWWGQARNNPFFYAPIMDEQRHHEWAQRIASGQGLGPRAFFRAPLYYYMLAGVYALCGPNIALGRLVGVVLGAASCYLIARVGAELAGMRVGLLAGLLAAFYWPLIHFDEQLLTVGLEIFFNTLMLLLILTGSRRGSLPLFFLAGVVWGLSAITRPNVLAFAPAACLWVYRYARPIEAPAHRPRARTLSGPRRLTAAALLLAGAALAILPVTIRNRVIGGEWVLIASNGGVNFYIGNNPQADGIAAVVPGTRADWEGGYEDTHRIPEKELGRKLTEGEVSDYWFRKGIDWIRAEPLAWIKLTLHKLRLFWSPHEIPNNQPTRFFASLSESSFLYWLGFPVVTCLGLAGLCTLGGQWRGWSLPVLFGLFYMGSVVLFFCPDRYRLPVVPVLILLGAVGLSRLAALWRERYRAALAGYVTVAVAASVFMLTNRPDAEWKRQEEGRAYHNLGAHYARLGERDPAQRDRAIQYLRRAVSLRPNDPYLHLSLGLWLSRFDQAEAAGTHLARAVALMPTHVEARVSYGDWLYARQKLAEAAEQYRQTLALEPDHLHARYYLGRVYAEQGQYAAAVEQFEQLLRRDPGRVAALFDLGTALSRLGRTQAAADRFRDVLRLDPANARAARRLARLLWEDNQAGEALGVLKAAEELAPDDVGVLTDLAGMLVSTSQPALRDSSRAIRLAQRALELGGRTNLTALDTLAVAYADLGEFDKAAQIAQEALRLARSTGQAQLAAGIERKLEYYEQARRRAAPTSGPQEENDGQGTPER